MFTFECLAQICFRIELLLMQARNKIVLIRAAEILNGLFVAVATVRFTVNVLNLVLAANIVLQSIHDPLDLERRIKPKGGSELSLALSDA